MANYFEKKILYDLNQSDEKINQSHTKFRSKEDNYFEIKIYVYQKNLNDKHYGVLWKHGHIKFFSVIILDIYFAGGVLVHNKGASSEP